MRFTGRIVIALAGSALLMGSWASCASSRSSDGPYGYDSDRPARRAELERLAACMAGSFSSQAQAAADPEYRDIRLFMVPIWKERADGPWLYVEQSAASSLERPYRQRVYRLVAMSDQEILPGGGTMRSDVYELPGDPLLFAGAHADPSRFASVQPEQLSLREGCSIYLSVQADGSFRGSTLGQGCASTLQGAAYATSEAFISGAGLETWDRGFNADGTQAWGAVKGPYEFVRVAD